jgi:hypothetical protein
MKTRSDAFQFGKELDWEKPAPGIRRQIMGYDGQLMMVKVEFEVPSVLCTNIIIARLLMLQAVSLN